jgi:hypothetical protein
MGLQTRPEPGFEQPAIRIPARASFSLWPSGTKGGKESAPLGRDQGAPTGSARASSRSRRSKGKLLDTVTRSVLAPVDPRGV